MANNQNLKPFKKGYDPRRWLGGRGKKSPEQQEGEKILLAVIWEELSREFDTRTKTPVDEPEIVDTLRLMVRQWIKRQPDKIAERIAGKVVEKVDMTSKGEKIGELSPEQIAQKVTTLLLLAQERKEKNDANNA